MAEELLEAAVTQAASAEEVQLRAWRNHELQRVGFNPHQRLKLIELIESGEKRLGGELYLEYMRHLAALGATVDQALLIAL